jgi:hypothetical protein
VVGAFAGITTVTVIGAALGGAFGAGFGVGCGVGRDEFPPPLFVGTAVIVRVPST